MNDPNWTARAFTSIVERLQGQGVNARLPLPGEGPDVYVAQLVGWVLDAVSKRAGAPNDPGVMVDPMFVPAVALRTKQLDGMMGAIEGMNAVARMNFYARGGRLGPDDRVIDHVTQIQTAKPHITEGGRSYKIEGVIPDVEDGRVFKPGEPLPPVKHEGGQ